jgi:hypothetical protein
VNFQTNQFPFIPPLSKGGNKYLPPLIEGAEIRIDIPFLNGQKMTTPPSIKRGYRGNV